MPSYLDGMLAAAEARGADTRGWLATAGLRPGELRAIDVRVPADRVVRLLEQALPHLPGGIGLELGRDQHVGNFGLVGLAMSTAATLGEALAIGLRFTPVIGGLMQFRPTPPPRPGVLALEAEMLVDAPSIEAFVTEEFLSSCLALARGLLGAPVQPLEIAFRYPEPAYVARYREVFACPLRFDAPRTRLLLETGLLGTPLPTRNPAAAGQVLALCEAQMPRLDGPPEVVEAVAALLRPRLAGQPRIAAIAALMHVSERTLRRKLADAGTSFHALHDRLRVEHALSLLQEPGARIAAVGARVGFRDPREFRRAFKRWTGTTPGAARSRR